jgi:hypothetical protein
MGQVLRRDLPEANGGTKKRLESYFHALAVGQALPALPVWLTESNSVSLDLESSYEESCRVLRIP